MKYEHKGIEITFTPQRAEFTATANGAALRTPSLDAMRKRIDDALAVKFTAFDALEYSADEVEEMHVIGLGKGEDRWNRGSPVFIVNGSRFREKTTVVPATAAARKAIKTWQRTHKENTTRIDQLKKQIDDARQKIPHLLAKDYGVKK